MFNALLQFGSSVHRKVFKRTSIGFVAFVVVIAVAVSIARVMGLTQVWYIGALISMGTRSLAHFIPLPTSILWIICVTFWAGAYLLFERVFCTIEFPREKTMNRFAEVY
jgi:Na+/melibiose symporter-like transporter